MFVSRIGSSVFVAAATLTFSACNGGLPQPLGAAAAPAANATPAIGFELGVTPSAPISDVVVTGAAVPTSTLGHHDIVLAAFVTAADAADADGIGPGTDALDLELNPLNGNPNPPADGNGAQDVFLAAFVNGGGDDSGAFSLRIFDVTQSQRCSTCHGQNYVPSSHPNHNTGAVCTSCHTTAVTGFSTDQFGLGWRSPPFCDGSGGCFVFDFRNRTPEDICTGIVSRFQPMVTTDAELRDRVKDHLKNDPFITWAIERAIEPGPVQLPKAPITLPDWLAATDAWVDNWGPETETDAVTRFNCVSARSRRDIALVSRRVDGTASGNASSRRPVLTYVPNDAFDVAGGVTSDGFFTVPAGFVFVAYDSDSTNLVASDTNGKSDVFRTTIELWVTADFVNGDETAGSIDLRYQGASNARVSVQDGTGAQCTARSTSPTIGIDGDRIAFVSEDGNLVDLGGPLDYAEDQNSKKDVFVREISTNRTRLVSVNSLGTGPGDDDSDAPVMSLGSNRAVAFESNATNLVAGDANGVQDVFYVVLTEGDLDLVDVPRRASVRTGGNEGHGGDAGHAALFVVDATANDLLVAFESMQTDLASPLPPNSTTNVYLHETLGTGRTTLMNQKRLPLLTIGAAGSGAFPADSRRPAITADGRTLLFDSLADNIDFLRPNDTNASEDVFAVDLHEFLGGGRIKPQRISVTRDGQDGDGSSTSARAANFRAPGLPGEPVFLGRPVVYDTLATNIPHAAVSPSVVVFLAAPAN